MARRTRKRRGLVLLLVLSMLVLFLLMGVTFLIVSGQHVRSARAHSKVEQKGNDPRKLTDMAMYQVVRGVTKRSPIGGHSLLGDLYGDDHAEGRITGASADNTVGNAIWELQYSGLTTPNLPPSPPNDPVSQVGYFNGRVLTVLDYDSTVPSANKPDKALSTRVIHFDPARNRILVEAFESNTGFNLAAFNRSRFIINGQPFNGPGAGYNSATGNVDAVVSVGGGNKPIALMPNYVAYAPPSRSVVGADEDYDAPDYQNMFLAMVPPGATASNQIIPSFHRPSLVNYWLARSGGSMSAALERAVILRPRVGDHPNFPPINLINGPWDVDNDLSGLADSIWLDIGLPSETRKDGRRVRPLAAILIKDMDGRLNLNANGNWAHTHPTFTTPVTDTAFAGSPGPVDVPRGRGVGPAEIYLGSVLGAQQSQVLSGRYGQDGQPGVAGENSQLSNDQLSRLKSPGIPYDYSNATVYSSYGNPPDVWGREALALDFGGHAHAKFSGTSGSTRQTIDHPYEINLSRRGAAGTAAGPADTPYTYAELERLLRWYDQDAVSLESRLLRTAPVLNGFNTAARGRRELFTTDSRHIPHPNVRGAFNQRVGLQGAAGRATTVIDLFRGKLSALPPADLDAQLAIMIPFEMKQNRPFNVNRPFGNGADDNGNRIVDESQELPSQAWAGVGAPGSFAAAVSNYLNNEQRVPPWYPARQIYARHLYCLMMLLVDENYIHPSIEFAPASPQARELTARRIAQWAINVVDFRDADGTMTPFEYDLDPFDADGWNVAIDGDPSTNERALGSAQDRRIVWGMEHPDLMISECSAVHNRRVKDTDVDGGGGPGGGGAQKKRVEANRREDHDLDQYRLPQGSLFLELYCPKKRLEDNGAPAPAEAYSRFPRELYSVGPLPLRGGAQTPYLNLGAMAPAGASGPHPVFRVSISEPHDKPTVNTFTERSVRPDTISYQPEDMDLLQWQNRDPAAVPGAEKVGIERVIWFANADPVALGTTGLPVPQTRVYWNRMPNPGLPAGGYAVVGPRQKTHVGSQAEMPAPDLKSGVAPMYLPSNQRVELLPNLAAAASGAVYFDEMDQPHASVAAGTVQRAVSIVAAANKPPGWQDNTTDLGPDCTGGRYGVGISVSEPFPDAYYPREPTVALAAGFPVDSWYDPANPIDLLPDQPFDRRAGMPLEGKTQTGTTKHFKTAFLQRLANPTIAYDPLTNPYITIDWTPIDLTVFSGEENTNRQVTYRNMMVDITEWIDNGFDNDPYDAAGLREQFDTRAKGQQKRAGSAPAAQVNIWSHVTSEPQNTGRFGGTDDYFKIRLRNTLGFLNSTFGPPQMVNASFVGDPERPFPWLTWNNRPFDNPMELMNVPTSTLARFPQEFGYNTGTDPYDPANFQAPYAHLLNFFQTSQNGQTPATGEAAHFYRLFDFVETPSRFVGTEKWYDAGRFSEPPAGPPSPSNADGLRAPFNMQSRFRDPGRVNANTIFDERIYRGVTFAVPDHRSRWNEFARSRRGYAAAGLDSAYPTRFAQPFRTAAGADMAPLPNLRQKGINATLLRQNPNNTASPLFELQTTAQHNDTNRNPYFRYQGATRLSNLLTTHSNVFAVWITIGYFELEPNPAGVDAAHPDGWRLGAEAGSAEGQVERHRAFYMIDRSIPVAFEPGENHNVDEAVVLRRFIE